MSDSRGGSAGQEDVDLVLLERLARIVDTVDPVPDHVRALGPALFALRDLEALLMEAVEVDAQATVRGTAPTSRMHFFQFGELSLDVELTTTGPAVRVVGVVADPGGHADTSVTLQTPSASFTTTPDEDGRFDIARAPSGMLRIVLDRADRADRPRLTTPWFESE